MYLSSTEIQENYEQHYKTLLKQSLVGKGDSLAQILVQRKSLVEEFKKCPVHRNWLEDVMGTMVEPIQIILEQEALPSFWRLGERPFPILTTTKMLDADLPAKASEILLEHGFEPKNRGSVESIFQRSSFTSGFRRYRCGFDSNDNPYIEGEDAPCLRSLVGITHELGHLIFEQESKDRSIGIQYQSEAAAHLAEETIVLRCLRAMKFDHLCEEYIHYLRQVDLLNFILFLEECSELTGHSLTPALFEPETYVFRESCITAIGYQAYNANASLMRWKAWESALP